MLHSRGDKTTLMNTYPLHPFQEEEELADVTLSVQVHPKKDRLSLCYLLQGDLSTVLFPLPSASPSRIDGLYKHTCFEIFLSDENGRYIEWNFSPSGDWCIFTFQGYRQGIEHPLKNSHRSFFDFSIILRESLELRVALSLKEIRGFLTTPTKLQISSVIETKKNTLSYWALQHGPKPDFHAPAQFVSLPSPKA